MKLELEDKEKLGAVLILGAVLSMSLNAGLNWFVLDQSLPRRQVACWSLAHPELKTTPPAPGAAAPGYELKASAFVSCVVLDTRTGEVVKEFIPSIPGVK